MLLVVGVQMNLLPSNGRYQGCLDSSVGETSVEPRSTENEKRIPETAALIDSSPLLLFPNASELRTWKHGGRWRCEYDNLDRLPTDSVDEELQF